MSRNKIQFGRPTRRTAKPAAAIQVTIDNLSLESRGVTKHEGKTTFVDGALPEEVIQIKITKQHKSFDEAKLVEIDTPSVHRVEAPCQHYGDCGGCQLQHLAPAQQLSYKQQAVLDLLQKMAKISPEQIASPLDGPHLNYRRSARIGVNQLSQDLSIIAGFRRKNSSKLLQIQQCEVLPKNCTSLFDQLRDRLQQIDNAKSITHIEFLQSEPKAALTFRCKQPLSVASRQHLQEMLSSLNMIGYLRFDDRIEKLSNDDSPLSYRAAGITFNVEPGDFVQVNGEINTQMIERAIDWLQLEQQDRVLDLFAGLGNFSLPIAQQVSEVIGVEGNEEMVRRASQNALNNHIDNATFYCANLSENVKQQPWYKQGFSKIILDPPRTGAIELISHLAKYKAEHILYISCDPSALARDSQKLQSLGYKMQKFCVMNMFPHTSHIESMALFIKDTTVVKKKKTIKL